MRPHVKHIIQHLKALFSENKSFLLFLFVLWLVLGFITFIKDMLFYSLDSDIYVDTDAILVRGFLIWTLALCYVPLIQYLSNKFPIDQRQKVWLHVPLHVIFSFLFLFVLAISFNLVFGLFYWSGVSFTQSMLWVLHWNNLGAPVAYWFILGGLVLMKNSSLYHQKRKRAIALQTELKQMQLNVLQMQLRPHFLFNALHTVSALIYEDQGAASAMLKKIHRYLKISLKETDKTEITLREELYFTMLYLDIEKERYSDRLHIERHIEPGIEVVLVPNMILQPLVENAVRHGISKKSGQGTLIIRALKMEGFTVLEIEDSGNGLDSPELFNTGGLGINNTVKRLQKIYPKNYDFTIDRSPLGGCRVRIQIPLRTKHARNPNPQYLLEMQPQ